jgi:hypothetical protein
MDPEEFRRMKEVFGEGLTHQLLGCAWGRAIHDREETEPCPEPAAQIVALHPGGGDEEVHLKLCVRHVTAVLELTTPHEGGT